MKMEHRVEVKVKMMLRESCGKRKKRLDEDEMWGGEQQERREQFPGMRMGSICFAL